MRSLSFFVLAFALTAISCPGGARAQTAGSDFTAYTDALTNNWQNYSWATVAFDNTSPVHGTGGQSIRVDAGGYQALYLHHAGFDPSAFQSLTFWIHGGTAGGQNLQAQITVNGNAQTAYTLPAPTANTWQQITIPLSSLGANGQSSIDGFWIQNTTGGTLPTFYVDDISFAAVPVVVPNPIRLQVDTGAALRQIDGRVFGVNTAIWDAQLGTSANRALLGALNQKSLRYPGGSAGDDYDWQTDRSVSNGSFQWASPFPTFAALAQSVGAQAYLIVNYGSGTPEQAAAWVAYSNGPASSTLALGTDVKGRDWHTVGYWAALRGASPLASDDGYNFLRVGHPAGFGFLYWEIGNECYGGWETDQHGGALSGSPNDPYTYAQNFAVFRQKMLAVDPTIHLGAVVTGDPDSYGNGQHPVTNPRDGTTHTGWSSVALAYLKTLGAPPNFVIYHDYDQEPGQESDSGLLNAATALAATRAAGLRQMVNDYLGAATGAGVELALTELNSVSYNPGKQSVSLVNGLYYAEAMAGVAGSGFNACQWWCLRNGTVTGTNNDPGLYGTRLFGDYGLLASGDQSGTPVNTPYPTYYAAKLMTHWAAGGDTALGGTSNYAPLSIHAARRAGSGDLCLLVVNRSASSDLTAQIELTGFAPGSATAALYRFGKPNDTGGTDLTTASLSNAAAVFTCAFPSYSMTVIDLAAPAAATAYASWQSSHFTSAEMSDPSISGDLADPDHDGICNLLEYAFGFDPKTPNSTGLPSVGSVAQGGSSYLTLSYNQAKAATDLVYTPQVSGDLRAWTSGSGSTQPLSVVDQGATQRVTVRDLVPITASTPQRYLRLEVTH